MIHFEMPVLFGLTADGVDITIGDETEHIAYNDMSAFLPVLIRRLYAAHQTNNLDASAALGQIGLALRKNPTHPSVNVVG